MKIEMPESGKQYKCNGKHVKILCVDRPGQIEGQPVVAVDEKGSVFFFTADGIYNVSRLASTYDLVEVKPYADFKVDDPVLVRYESKEDELRRYFAGVDKDGRPTVFVDGRTSWSGEQSPIWVVSTIRRPDGGAE